MTFKTREAFNYDQLLLVYQTQGLEAVASQLESIRSIEDSVRNANSMHWPAPINAAEQEPGTVTRGNGPSDRREAVTISVEEINVTTTRK